MKRAAFYVLCAMCLLIVSHACSTTGRQGKKIDDSAIVARIRTLISEDPASSRSAVRVFVQEGKVTLNGTVPDDDTKSRFLTAAKGVAGVKSVSDDLRKVP